MNIGALGRILLPILALTALVGCNDDLSTIGESVQSPNDKAQANLRYLQFEVSTVEAQPIYTAWSTNSTLGAISDPTYGDFRAEYIAPIRYAPGYRLDYTPMSGRIDSVKLMLDLQSFVGREDALMKVSVYTAPPGYRVETYTVDDIEEYKVPSRLVGERSYTIADNVRWTKESGSARDSIGTLAIPLDREFGQRIYDLSRTNPEYFASQESFSQNVLGGLVVATSAGRGSVMQITGTTLVFYYTYTALKEGSTTGETESRVATSAFISSRTTGHTNALSSQHIDGLTTANAQYAYIKQPAGVVAEVVLPKEQMERLFISVGDVKVGENWRLADTQLALEVSNPSNLVLNPPSYMLLLPKDSVQSFFKHEQTERTRLGSSYLSNAYSINTRRYNFNNISRVITSHLARYASRNASGAWTVSEDLRLHMLPVLRSVAQAGSSGEGITTGLTEYLMPSFVRLDKTPEKLRIKGVYSEFEQ